MHYLIMADLEGASCVFFQEQCSVRTKAWKQAKEYLTSNLNAVIRGIYHADPHADIIVRDLHNQGYNVSLKELDTRVKYIGGPYHKPIIWFGNLSGFDLAFMVGIHARSGSTGFTPHTQFLEFSEVIINSKPICETEFTASLISEVISTPYPIGFVSGENIAIEQVKESICRLKDENRLLFQGAKMAIENRHKFQLFRFKLPLDVQISFLDPDLALKISKRWQLKLLNEATITFTSQSTIDYLKKIITVMYLTPYMVPLIPLTPLLRPLYRFLAR
jgi:D-aminopeptidase